MKIMPGAIALVFTSFVCGNRGEQTAVDASTQGEAHSDEAPVSMLITQGTADDIVVPDVCGEASRDFWIERDGCTTATFPTSTSGCVANEGCEDGLAVVYCTHGGDHMVPGNAGAYIWEFFNSFQ